MAQYYLTYWGDDVKNILTSQIFSNFYVNDYYDIPLFDADPVGLIMETITARMVRK